MTSDVITSERVSRAGECIDGRYQLDAEIGAGGLGSVYRATQTKLARQVAVKLLHESMGASEVQRLRFEREARSLAALEHPNIVSILDYGVADAQPYIVTELLEGETLAQRLRHGSLPLDQGLAFADELLDALAFMHEAGVVHRDLKASNVFLQRVHGGERVKLLDFGLAKTTVIGPGTKGDATLTRAGTVVGTPAYMSPEQATGDVVDARSDVYAVGVLLYQMLTGRLPFAGDAIDQVRSHLVEPVPALERTSPSRRLDAALEGLIRRAMAKRREDRFENAREMLHALAQIRDHNSGGGRSLPPPAAKTQARRSARRALPPLGATLRWLRWFCVVAVIVQLLLLVLLVRDAEGRAALAALGARSGVALTSLGERSMSWGSRLAVWARSLPVSQRERAREHTQPAQPAADEPSVIAPLAGAAAADSRPASVEQPASSGSLPVVADELAAAGAAAPVVADELAAAGAVAPVVADELAAAGAAASSAPPQAAAPAVSPEAQQPGAASDAPAAGQPPAAAPIAAVPGPPRPRNPWARGAPAELRGIRRSILAGGIGDDRVAGTLRTYSQSHPGDPRGHLLLGMMYLNRNWRSDAVAQFASAIKADLSARGAPEVLDNLIELVASGRAEAEASALIMRAYGTEALPALAAKIAAARAPDAAARLRGLRARIDHAQGPKH